MTSWYNPWVRVKKKKTIFIQISKQVFQTENIWAAWGNAVFFVSLCLFHSAFWYYKHCMHLRYKNMKLRLLLQQILFLYFPLFFISLFSLTICILLWVIMLVQSKPKSTFSLEYEHTMLLCTERVLALSYLSFWAIVPVHYTVENTLRC